MKLRAAMLCLLAVCSACGSPKNAQNQAQQTPQSAPRELLIDSRGVVMPLADAVRTARFAPFLPSAQMIAVAVIPPLSDARGRDAHPGMAIEYERRGDALLLSQWPRAGLEISVGAIDATRRPCAPVAYKSDGLLWTTRNGRVMTLQPDGTVGATRIAREADRLLRAGACGETTRTLSRPLPTPSRVVSSPRRSAS